MKFKQITAIFLGFTLLSVILRLLHVATAVNMINGFSVSGKSTLANCLMVIILLLVAATGVIAYTVKRCPLKMPKMNTFLMISSLFCGACTAFASVYQLTVKSGQNTLGLATSAFGIFTAAVFILYALNERLSFKLPNMAFIVAVVYCILRLVSIFIKVTSVATMWNNFLWALCECAQLLFMLQIGKFANNVNGDTHKKMLAVSFIAIVLSSTYALPNIFLYLPYRFSNGYGSGTLTMLTSTVFALGMLAFEVCFTFSFFANKNLKQRSYRRSHKIKSDFDSHGARFYLGDDVPKGASNDTHEHHRHHEHSSSETSVDAEYKTEL